MFTRVLDVTRRVSGAGYNLLTNPTPDQKIFAVMCGAAVVASCCTLSANTSETTAGVIAEGLPRTQHAIDAVLSPAATKFAAMIVASELPAIRTDKADTMSITTTGRDGYQAIVTASKPPRGYKAAMPIDPTAITSVIVTKQESAPSVAGASGILEVDVLEDATAHWSADAYTPSDGGLSASTGMFDSYGNPRFSAAISDANQVASQLAAMYTPFE